MTADDTPITSTTYISQTNKFQIRQKRDHSTHQRKRVSIPTEGEITLGKLRAVIPKHCFQVETLTSLLYLLRDITSIVVCIYISQHCIRPFINYWTQKLDTFNKDGHDDDLLVIDIEIVVINVNYCYHLAMYVLGYIMLLLLYYIQGSCFMALFVV